MAKNFGMRKGTTAMVALTFSAALVLVGCGDEETTDSAAAGGSDGETTEATMSATPNSDPSSSPSAAPKTPKTEPSFTPSSPPMPTSEPTPLTPPEDPPADALAGEACLPGNWFLDNEEFSDFMASVSGSAINKMSGSVMVTFREDGTTSTYYDGWTYDMEGGDRSMSLSKDGTDSGTYHVAADGSMALADTEMSAITTAWIERDGEMVGLRVEPTPSVFSDASFTCEGDKLTMVSDGATTILHREH